MKKEQEKMTLEQYQEKYNKRINVKKAKSFLVMVLALIGLLLCYFLTRIVIDLYKWNEIAGYVAIGVAILVLIFFYIVPICRIIGKKTFITRVNSTNFKQAKSYNKKLRKELAIKIVDFNKQTDNIGWYDEIRVNALSTALDGKDDNQIKLALNDIYSKDVKKISNMIISEQAVKVGLLTALSQSERIDTIIVSIYEINLIKKLVFLYGFRPSEDELLKLYSVVLTNALIAYGVESIPVNASNVLGKASESIPILGSVISTLIGSAAQGIINGLLTVIIGFQTKKYLKNKYHLQDILDSIDFDDDETEGEVMEEVKSSILKETKKLKKSKDKE